MKIKINPKKTRGYENSGLIHERQRETQKECCDEIQKLRYELETMKMVMDEMRQQMNEMRLQLQSGCRHDRIAVKMDSLDKPVSDFREWINGMEITAQDLEAVFESKDMVDWMSKFIITDLKQRSSHPYPLSAIKGTKSELLMYDEGVWAKMTDHEFASTIVNKVFKKLLAVFTAWKNEHYSRILTSEHFSTLYHSNYARILSFNEHASKLKMNLFHKLLL
jgi:hypothetical protein